jgi:hypothetical protein
VTKVLQKAIRAGPPCQPWVVTQGHRRLPATLGIIGQRRRLLG